MVSTTLGQIAIFQEKKLFVRFDFNYMKICLKLNWPQTVTELLDVLDAKIKTSIYLISIYIHFRT